jgi:hypothetical protein
VKIEPAVGLVMDTVGAAWLGGAAPLHAVPLTENAVGAVFVPV